MLRGSCAPRGPYHVVSRMPAPSVHSPDVRAVECESCGRAQLVAGRVPEALSLTCAYCGHEQVRSLGGSDGPPYRTAPRPRGANGRLVSFDLRETPPGLEALARRRVPIADTRARFDAVRTALSTMSSAPRDPEAEWHLVWLGSMLAARHHIARDLLSERAVLEATLERTTLPPYRNLLLARLSRLAASGASSGDGLALAQAWLDLAAPHTGIAEVDGDVDAAIAYLDIQRGDPQAALARLGQEEASPIRGSARVVADLLRVEALERLGRALPAYGLLRIATRGHGQAVVTSIATRYALARRSRARLVRAGIGALALLLVLPVVVVFGIESDHLAFLVSADAALIAVLGIVLWLRRKGRRVTF